MENYIIAIELQKGTISSEEHEKNLRKVIRAVIKKMVVGERMLMYADDGENEGEKVLKIHPNYNFS